MRWLLGIAVFGALMFGVNALLDGRLSSLVRLPAAPLQGLDASLTAAVGNARAVLSRNDVVIRERDVLRERVRELEIYALNNQVLKAENEALRRLLGDTPEDGTGIAVRVLTRGGIAPYGVLTIAQPESTTLSVGARVFGAHGVGIGVVTDTFPTYAQVELFSQPQRSTDVLIQSGDTTTPTTVTGTGSGNFVARVPRDVTVQVGDAVVLAQDSRIVIGMVGDVTVTPADAFKTVRIRVPLNLATLRFVSVE